MKSLVVTPTPHDTESMWGYLVRVTEANGYATPRAILTYAESTTHGSFKLGKKELDNLSLVLNKPVGQLQKIANYAPSKEHSFEFKVLDHNLHQASTRSLINLRYPRVCPDCVNETGRIDAFWDLEIAILCPRHLKTAINACPKCSKRLSQFRPGLLKCKCGNVLTSTNAVNEDIRTNEIMQMVYAKLHGKPILSIPNQSNYPLNELEKLSLRSLLRLLFALSRLALGLRTLAKFTSVEMVQAAAKLLTNWPMGFRQFMSDYAKKRCESLGDNISFSTCFIRIYTGLFSKNFTNHELQFIRREYTHFGLHLWDGVKMNTALDPSEKPRFVSIAEFARRFGITHCTVKRWGDRGSIVLKKLPAGKNYKYFIDTHIYKIPDAIDTNIRDALKAAELIGLSVKLLRELRQSGHYAIENISVNKKGYSQKDLINLRQKFIDLSPKLDGNVDSQPFISLEYLLKKAVFFSIGAKVQFIKDYLDGKIKSYGRTGDSFNQVFFHKSVFDNFRFEIKKTLAIERGVATNQESIEMIGTYEAGIQSLVDAGFITRLGKKNSDRLDRSSVVSFSTKYLGLSSLAEQHGTSTNRLIALCKEFDIPTLRVESRKEFDISFIFRSDEQRLSNLHLAHPSTFNVIEKKRLPVGGKNLKKVKEYIDQLRENNQSPPIQNGNLNLAEICRILKIHKNVPYTNRAAVLMLKNYLVEYSELNNIILSPVERVQNYFDKLRITNAKPPTLGDRLNKAEIARTCGVTDYVFNYNNDVIKVLQDISRWYQIPTLRGECTTISP